MHAEYRMPEMRRECAGSMHAPGARMPRWSMQYVRREHACAGYVRRSMPGRRHERAGVCTRRAPSMHAPDTSAQSEEYAPEHARAMPGRRPSMYALEYACAGVCMRRDRAMLRSSGESKRSSQWTPICSNCGSLTVKHTQISFPLHTALAYAIA
jgi:hypothetical protein